jgi:quinol monooxygenase YgiN
VSTTVVARFYPKAGSEAQVQSILTGMVEPTRAEPGCRRYDLFRSGAGAESGFCLIERYVDQAAIELHRQTDHYKAYRAVIIDLLARPIDVAILQPLDSRDV